MGVFMNVRSSFLKSIFPVLAVCAVSIASPLFSADEPFIVRLHVKKTLGLQDRIVVWANELLKKAKKIAKDERVRRYVLNGALSGAAVVAAYYLGKQPWVARKPGDILAQRGNATQIYAEEQKGDMCGYHAVYNAAYLDKTGPGVEQFIQENSGNINEARKEVAANKTEVADLSSSWLMADEVERLCNDAQLQDFLIYTGDTKFTGIRSVGTGNIGQRISAFKRDSSKRSLPIIINTGNHWIVDVISRNNGSYQHTIADSKNHNQLGWWFGSEAVHTLIALERSVGAQP